MPIRTISTVATLKPWLPSDYSTTGWDDTSLQTALDDGYDPRMIAAEVWEDYAGTLTEADSQAVKQWTNLDTSVEYAAATSPRDFAMRQARHHRARAKVKVIPLVHARIERDEAEGLLDEPPAEQKTTTSGPGGQE